MRSVCVCQGIFVVRLVFPIDEKSLCKEKKSEVSTKEWRWSNFQLLGVYYIIFQCLAEGGIHKYLAACRNVRQKKNLPSRRAKTLPRFVLRENIIIHFVWCEKIESNWISVWFSLIFSMPESAKSTLFFFFLFLNFLLFFNLSFFCLPAPGMSKRMM